MTEQATDQESRFMEQLRLNEQFGKGTVVHDAANQLLFAVCNLRKGDLEEARRNIDWADELLDMFENNGLNQCCKESFNARENHCYIHGIKQGHAICDCCARPWSVCYCEIVGCDSN